MLERLGMRNAQVLQMTNGDLVELANLIDERDSLRTQLDAQEEELEYRGGIIRALLPYQDRAVKAEKEVAVLKNAAEYAAHALEQGRVWGGMDWHYNPLHPVHYKPALKKLRDVLDGNEPVDEVSELRDQLAKANKRILELEMDKDGYR